MAISVAFLHNPEAGFEQYPKEKLIIALQRKGFEVTYIDIKKDNFEESLRKPYDLLVVAGGDGTIVKVCREVVGKNIPVGILPQGTANNIAMSLGKCGEPEGIIAGWDLSRRKLFIPCIINGPEGENFFLESAGFGLLARLIAKYDKDTSSAGTREEELNAARRHQQKILKDYRSHHYTVFIDGQEYSGRYLLLEIMNVKFAGPNMYLAPDADPGDEFMNIVMVKEDEKEIYAEYLSGLIKGEKQQLRLPGMKARRIEIEPEGGHYHIDSEAIEIHAPVKIIISLHPESLEFLVN